MFTGKHAAGCVFPWALSGRVTGSVSWWSERGAPKLSNYHKSNYINNSKQVGSHSK